MTTMNVHDFADTMFAQIDPFCSELDDQALVSQERCVDHLLDLFNSTENTVVRAVIADALDEIRHLSAVAADEMQLQVQLLGAAVAVEAAFDAVES